ncbi:hypothetical protein FHG87_016960 [Trinorchestia longiramus]|nr:hypothetical protein FHG87_016960 [Trinorchestia longiramus]
MVHVTKYMISHDQHWWCSCLSVVPSTNLQGVQHCTHQYSYLSFIRMRSPFEAKQVYLKLLAVSLATAFNHDWTITEISETWIGSRSFKQEQMQIYHQDDKFRRLSMAAACAARGWCMTVCHQGGGGLLLLNLISAPRNKGPGGPPLMKCLTNSRRNNIITAQSGIIVHDFTPVFNSGPKRVPTNLLNGVYDFAVDSCFCTNNVKNPFVVFNFGSMREIRRVSLMAESDGEQFTSQMMPASSSALSTRRHGSFTSFSAASARLQQGLVMASAQPRHGLSTASARPQHSFSTAWPQRDFNTASARFHQGLVTASAQPRHGLSTA